MGESIAALYVTAGADIGGFQRGMGQVRNELRGVSGEAQNVMRTVRNLGGALLTALGGAAVTSMAANFDRSMRNVRAVTGRTTESMAALRGEIMRMSTTQGPQALADAYYDIAGGVADASKHMAILNAAVATAEAGQANLAGTTQGMISIMNAYGYEASRASVVSDVFTRTVGVGVGQMDEFVAAMSPIGKQMADAGVSFESLGSMMAFMTAKGVSASMAATQLRQATIAFLNPNKEMEAALRRTGFTSGSALLRQRGLAGAIEAVRNASGGSADKMAKMLGSVEALNAASILGAEDWAEFSQNFMQGLSGATAAARALQLESPTAKIDAFRAKLEGLSIGLGDILLQGIGTAAELATPVVSLLTEALDQIKAEFQSNLLGEKATAFKGLWDRFWDIVFPKSETTGEEMMAMVNGLNQPVSDLPGFAAPMWKEQDFSRSNPLSERLTQAIRVVGPALKTAFEELITTAASEVPRLMARLVNTVNDAIQNSELPAPIKWLADFTIGNLGDLLDNLSKINWSALTPAVPVLLGVGLAINGGWRGVINMGLRITGYEAFTEFLRLLGNAMQAFKDGQIGTALENLAKSIGVLLVALVAFDVVNGGRGLMNFLRGVGGMGPLPTALPGGAGGGGGGIVPTPASPAAGKSVANMLGRAAGAVAPFAIPLAATVGAAAMGVSAIQATQDAPRYFATPEGQAALAVPRQQIQIQQASIDNFYANQVPGWSPLATAEKLPPAMQVQWLKTTQTPGGLSAWNAQTMAENMGVYLPNYAKSVYGNRWPPGSLQSDTAAGLGLLENPRRMVRGVGGGGGGGVATGFGPGGNPFVEDVIDVKIRPIIVGRKQAATDGSELAAGASPTLAASLTTGLLPSLPLVLAQLAGIGPSATLTALQADGYLPSPKLKDIAYQGVPPSKLLEEMYLEGLPVTMAAPKKRAGGGPTDGWTLVGEYGPEMAYFGSGSYVAPNSALRGGGGGGGPTHVHVEVGGREILEVVLEERDKINGRGWLPR